MVNMDTIKNLLYESNCLSFFVTTNFRSSGGNTQNNETLDRSAQTTGTTTNTGSLSGEGSHLPQTQATPAGTTSGLGSATTSQGVGNTTGTGYSSGTTTAGPHSSNLANKADPRIDSDNSRTGIAGVAGSNTTSGSQGGIGSSTGIVHAGTSQDSYHSSPTSTSVQGVSLIQ